MAATKEQHRSLNTIDPPAPAPAGWAGLGAYIWFMVLLFQLVVTRPARAIIGRPPRAGQAPVAQQPRHIRSRDCGCVRRGGGANH